MSQKYSNRDTLDKDREFEVFPKWTRSKNKHYIKIPATPHNKEQQTRRNKESKEPSLVWALAKTFGGTFVVGGVFKFLQDFLNFVGPLLLKYVL